MPDHSTPASVYKPRVTFLRRRPRPGALARPDDLPLPPEGRQAHEDLRRGVRDTRKPEDMDRSYRQQKG